SALFSDAKLSRSVTSAGFSFAAACSFDAASTFTSSGTFGRSRSVRNDFFTSAGLTSSAARGSATATWETSSSASAWKHGAIILAWWTDRPRNVSTTLASRDQMHLEPRRMLRRVVDLLRGFLEVARTRRVDVDKLLRVAVDEREPGALDLHHDAVPGAKRVV